MSVNLSKGQRVSLQKSNGGGLSRVRMGLGDSFSTRTMLPLVNATLTLPSSSSRSTTRSFSTSTDRTVP